MCGFNELDKNSVLLYIQYLWNLKSVSKSFSTKQQSKLQILSLLLNSCYQFFTFSYYLENFTQGMCNYNLLQLKNTEIRQLNILFLPLGICIKLSELALILLVVLSI